MRFLAPGSQAREHSHTTPLIVPVIYVRIGGIAPVHRGITVRANFRAGDAGIDVAVVKEKCQRSLWPGIAVLRRTSKVRAWPDSQAVVRWVDCGCDQQRERDMIRNVAVAVALLAVAGPVEAQDLSESESTEEALLGRMMWEAFMCFQFASVSDRHDESEVDRLYMFGSAAGRNFYEALETGAISEEAWNAHVPIAVSFRLGGTHDFMLGRVFEAAIDEAEGEISERMEGAPLELMSSERILAASLLYEDSNCELLGR